MTIENKTIFDTIRNKIINLGGLHTSTIIIVTIQVMIEIEKILLDGAIKKEEVLHILSFLVKEVKDKEEKENLTFLIENIIPFLIDVIIMIAKKDISLRQLKTKVRKCICG